MADTAVAITAGSGTNIDTRTEGTNSNHRQVIVIGDPATNAGVAPVDVTNGLAVQVIPALPAGTNAIGKLAANSGVTIGAVELAVGTTATLTSLASAATSAQLLASTSGRRGLILQNTDVNDVFVKYGTTASATSFTVQIRGSGGYWEMPQPIYTGRIDAIWAADGSGSLFATEIT